MKQIYSQLAFAALLALLTVGKAHADDVMVESESTPEPSKDEIVLKNGSIIIGEVQSAHDGVVKISTEFAGDLQIPSDQIQSLKTQQPVTVQLADKTVVRDQPLTVVDEKLVLKDDAGNTSSLALDQLLILNPKDWELGNGYNWSGLASIAMTRESGNSDTTELDYKLETIWRSVRDRFTLKAYGEEDESNDVKNAENWNVIGKYDYFLDGPTYVGVNAYAESDEFADLKLRYYIGPYIGRDFFTDPLFTLSAEVGASFVDEDFYTAPDQEYPGANWSLNMSSNYLGGESRLYFDQLGIWNLKETSDIIVNTTMGLAFPMFWNLEASAEVLWEYDSGAVEGVEDLDETYRFRIGYVW